MSVVGYFTNVWSPTQIQTYHSYIFYQFCEGIQKSTYGQILMENSSANIYVYFLSDKCKCDNVTAMTNFWYKQYVFLLLNLG